MFEAPRYTDTIVEGDYTTSNQVLLDVSSIGEIKITPSDMEQFVFY